MIRYYPFIMLYISFCSHLRCWSYLRPSDMIFSMFPRFKMLVEIVRDKLKEQGCYNYFFPWKKIYDSIEDEKK